MNEIFIQALLKQEINDSNETEEENSSYSLLEISSNKDRFIQDPALIREKTDERQRYKKGMKNFILKVNWFCINPVNLKWDYLLF